MMLNVLNRQKIELAGLDIGTSAVKLVHLNKTADGYTLISAVAEPITACADDGEKQRQNRLEAVKTCLQKANWKNKSVVCGVSGPEIVVRGFTFPPLPDAAVAQAVRMEAQQVCPLDMNQSTLDFQLIQTPESQPPGKASKAEPRRGVMAVGTQRAIEEQTALLTEAGGKVLMVDVNALALLNCLDELQLLDPYETAAVIDVGTSLTNVVIYGRDGLPFVRDITKAGRTIIQQMSRELDVPGDEIQRIVTRDHVSEPLDDKWLLALNKAMAPLVGAVNETLRFYSFQEEHSGVDRIFLCGGFALIDTFAEFLKDALPVSMELLNPLAAVNLKKSDNEKQALIQNGPVYAVAAGLAMRTV